MDRLTCPVTPYRRLFHFAIMVEQRNGGAQVAAMLDFTNEDHVIAFLVAAAVEAFKRRDRAVEQGHARMSGLVGNACPAVYALGRELHGQFLLLRSQHMHRIVRAGHEHRQRRRAVGHAPQHQRRMQRHRIEGAHRHAHGLTLGIERGHDGHAGRELAKCLAEIMRGKVGRLGHGGVG